MVPQLLPNRSQKHSEPALMPTLFAVTQHARRMAPNTILIALLAFSERVPKMGYRRSQQAKRVLCLPQSFLDCESRDNKKFGDQATTTL
jgi:hypothetical protein